MKKALSVLLIAALIPIFSTACGSKTNNPDQPPLASGSVIVADDTIPDSSPNISGVVTGIAYVREGIVMLVEIPDKSNNYADGRVYVTVTSKTVIESENKTRYDSYNYITPGDTVSVWYSGNATGTSPEYAMARGVRVTAQVEDLLLTVRHGDTTIMASPAEGEVTSTDIRPLLYGSYLIWSGEGNLHTRFAKKPKAVSASAVSIKSGETTFHFKSETEDVLELPATMPQGEYTVTVKAEYEESADYYIFTLCIQ